MLPILLSQRITNACWDQTLTRTIVGGGRLAWHGDGAHPTRVGTPTLLFVLESGRGVDDR